MVTPTQRNPILDFSIFRDLFHPQSDDQEQELLKLLECDNPPEESYVNESTSNASSPIKQKSALPSVLPDDEQSIIEALLLTYELQTTKENHTTGIEKQSDPKQPSVSRSTDNTPSSQFPISISTSPLPDKISEKPLILDLTFSEFPNRFDTKDNHDLEADKILLFFNTFNSKLINPTRGFLKNIHIFSEKFTEAIDQDYSEKDLTSMYVELRASYPYMFSDKQIALPTDVLNILRKINDPTTTKEPGSPWSFEVDCYLYSLRKRSLPLSYTNPLQATSLLCKAFGITISCKELLKRVTLLNNHLRELYPFINAAEDVALPKHIKDVLTDIHQKHKGKILCWGLEFDCYLYKLRQNSDSLSFTNINLIASILSDEFNIYIPVDLLEDRIEDFKKTISTKPPANPLKV